MSFNALLRPPGPELARCELTWLAREPLDIERACEQHLNYRRALFELGARVVELEALPEHPDACFVEDAAVVFDDCALIARPGAASRRGEPESVERALAPLRELLHLNAPATLDGGDVLVLGELVLVGQSTRTNHAGLKQLAHLLLERGKRVKAVEVTGCLHLKSACCSLDEETVLAHRPWINSERMKGLRIVDIPLEEPRGANVLRVGDTLLVSASAPRTAELLARLGHDVRVLDISELEKAEAGLTCLALLFDA